jgi:hypothetical protein
VSYQLIPIREADRQQLLSDVARSPDHHSRIRCAIRIGQFPSHWALDADSGNYLVRLMHEDVRPEILAERQAFRFGGELFEVRFDDMFFDTVRIAPLCGAAIADVAAFREELTRAFQVHGRYGDPRLPSPLVPEFGDWPA